MTVPKMRPAETIHVPVLAALHGAAFADAWDDAAIADLLVLPGTHAIVAETDAGPRGFVVWRIAADEAEIVTLAVVPEARRRGIGRRLLVAAEAAAVAAGADRLFLEVAADNEAALALYRGAGYRDIGRRPDYYRTDQGKTDALTMARTLAEFARKVP